MSVTPEMLRTQANMMKNMDHSQFEMMKRMAANMNPNMFPGGSPFQGSTSAPAPAPKAETPKDAPKSNYPLIDKMKSKGNDHFRANNFDAAATSYYEVKNPERFQNA
jgi:uncharacterized protein involved in copper resistance